MRKVLRGKCFASVEEVKQKKTAEALKVQGPKSRSSKTVLSNGKNISVGVLHQIENTLKVTEV